jgi:hypothetical protein
MGGLWRNNEATKGGKYLVQRRDGTVPEWPWFVLGARDPAAGAALMAYANEAEARGYDPKFVADVRTLAREFQEYLLANGAGDPTSGPHRADKPEVAALLATAKGA